MGFSLAGTETYVSLSPFLPNEVVVHRGYIWSKTYVRDNLGVVLALALKFGGRVETYPKHGTAD